MSAVGSAFLGIQSARLQSIGGQFNIDGRAQAQATATGLDQQATGNVLRQNAGPKSPFATFLDTYA